MNEGRMSYSVGDGAYLTRQLARYSGRDHCGRRIGHTLYVHQTPWPVRYLLPIANIDLNLLTSLDALLAEGTVVGAALRLQCVGDEPDTRDYGRRQEIRCSCARVEAWCQRRTLPN